MNARFVSAFVASAVLSWTVPALAHHPFAAEYDKTKPVHVSGTVSKIDWSNPHAMLHMEGKDKSGEEAKWTFELGGPNALKRRGWSETTLKAGDKIAVDGWMSREGGHLANAKSVTMSNGKELNAASSYFEKSPSKKNSH
jgi:hypothetical protein